MEFSIRVWLIDWDKSLEERRLRWIPLESNCYITTAWNWYWWFLNLLGVSCTDIPIISESSISMSGLFSLILLWSFTGGSWESIKTISSTFLPGDNLALNLGALPMRRKRRENFYIVELKTIRAFQLSIYFRERGEREKEWKFARWCKSLGLSDFLSELLFSRGWEIGVSEKKWKYFPSPKWRNAR